MRYYKQDDVISRVASDGVVHHRLVGDRLWIDGDEAMVCGDEIKASDGEFKIDHYEVSIMDDDSWGYTTPLHLMSGFITKGEAIKSAKNAYDEDFHESSHLTNRGRILRDHFASQK